MDFGSPTRTQGSDVALNFTVGSRSSRAALIATIIGAVWFLAASVLPAGLPAGIALRGVVIGLLGGLLAMGLVFIYRANRIINFAMGELGAFAATLAYELITQSGLPYVVAIVLSVLAATALAALIEVAVLRRFARASRLIAAVVTIGLAQLLLFLQLILPPLFERYALEQGAGRLDFPSPFRDTAFTLSGTVFRQDEVVALIVVPLVALGLTLFLWRSRFGTAIRAASQDADRAGLLGVPVFRLHTLSWAIAGALAGIAAILRAPIVGFFPGDLGGASLLTRALAAAAIGRFTSLPVTLAAAVGLSIVEQVYVFNFARGAPLDLLVLAVVVVGLLVRRAGGMGRAGWSDASTWKAVELPRPDVRWLVDPRLRRMRRAGIAVAVVAVLSIPFVANLEVVRLVSVILVFSIVAASLVVLTGWAGQISLGHWALVGVGGATTAVLSTLPSPPPFVLILLGSVVVGAATGALLGLPALRLAGLFYGVTTLAFAVAAGGYIFRLELLQPEGLVRRPQLLGFGDLSTEGEFFFVVLVVTVIVLIGVRNLRRSRVGRLLIAVRDNELAAGSYGTNAWLVKLTAFGISGGLAGAAGCLYVFLIQNFDAADFQASRSILLFGMVVVGGLGSLAGAVLGAVYVLAAQFLLPSWGSFLATGLGVIMFLMVFPGGLAQIAFRWRDRLATWITGADRAVRPPRSNEPGELGAGVPVFAEPKLEPSVQARNP